VRTALPLVLLLATTSPSFADSSPRVRGASPRETRVIEHLLDRSATARALVSELETSDVIVYVQLAPNEAGGHAATQFVTATRRDRFLRIVIGAMTPPYERGSLLAHELQHAVEIARDPEVRDDEGMRRLYGRIGENRSARASFETAAARDIGLRVRRELAASGNRRSPGVPELPASTIALGVPDEPVPARGPAVRATADGDCARVD
jgi:hypothetical protein